MSPKICISLFIFLISIASNYSSDQQDEEVEVPLITSAPIPSYPTTVHSRGGAGNLSCHLDLSSELFGGVSNACSTLDRDRCCPVLAAWLFAAHARSALTLNTPSPPPTSPLVPIMPDDSQKCVDSLHSSLKARNITLSRPNATCDTVLCFCGIRLHQIGSLTCPSAFNLTPHPSAAAGGGGNVTDGGGYGNATVLATPTPAVRQLERDCQNSSFLGCTRCLHSLQKLKSGGKAAVISERGERMFDRDCQMMGLTWLLAKNKTLYIPTVSAVIRAVMYSSDGQEQDHRAPPAYKCRADQDNMPLAVNSLQFQKLYSSSSSSSSAAPASAFSFALAFSVPPLYVLLIMSSIPGWLVPL